MSSSRSSQSPKKLETVSLALASVMSRRAAVCTPIGVSSSPAAAEAKSASSGIEPQTKYDNRRRQCFGGGAQERRVLNGEVARAPEGERLVAIGGKLIGRTCGIAEQVAHGVVVLADGEATERHRAGGIWIAHPRRSTCARRATRRGAGRAACRSRPRRPGRSGAARGACAGRSTGLADRPRPGGDREPAERADQGSA